MKERPKLIDLILSLGYEVIGHGSSIERIEEHMNFSDRKVRICLTDDNNHIFCVRSDQTYMKGGYDGYEASVPVEIKEEHIKILEPFLFPDESIVDDIKNWEYVPYEERRAQEIREHNEWCRQNNLMDCLIPERKTKRAN